MHWYECRAKQKMISETIFSNLWIIQFPERLWKIWENIEISKMQQQKQEVIIYCQNQTNVEQIFRKFIS